MKHVVPLILVCIVSAGCTTRYAKVRFLSEPDLARVAVVETGQSLGSTPDSVVIARTFVALSRRRARLSFEFSKVGYCDQIRPVVIEGVWRHSASAAENGAELITVHATLTPAPCDCRCNTADKH
jgi:hypothetical protein